MTNLILSSDSYKASQWKQYPPDTARISSYIETRGGMPESVFFGLQAYIKEYLTKPITLSDVEEAESFIIPHGLPFNKEGWLRLIEKHGGYMPISIEAVAEGTVMSTSNVQVQVVNTDPEFAWLTSYLETAMLRAVWYPSTVATVSRNAKRHIDVALRMTSDVPVEDQIGFKLHDFGARGATSHEAAMLGGMGHLVNFLGTDTMEALIGARKYYGEDVAGFSIPASEHSTMTSWGRDRETDAYRNMLEMYSGEGKLLACVSDSYDIFNAVDNIWGTELADEVRNSGGTLVVRPDSGDPNIVPIQVIEKLMDKFGSTVNSKGYLVLPDYVRVIQGDGINAESLPRILNNMEMRNLSADNIAFGMGGGLLQQCDRDTLKYAMKCSARQDTSGKWHDVYKDPISGGKTSKKGRLGLVHDTAFGADSYHTVPESVALNRGKNLLVEVFRNGELLVDQKLSDIRDRAKIVEKEKVTSRYDN